MVWITLPNEYDDRQWIRYETALNMQHTAIMQRNVLDFYCALNPESNPHETVRQTSIACIVGHQKCREVDVLQQMMEAGMNIARLNLTLNYGNLEYHKQTVQNLRKAARNYSKKLGVPFPLAIACSTIGPLVQTGYLEGGLDSEIELKIGSTVKVTTDPAYKEKGSNQVIFIDYEGIFDSIVPGRIIWIDDGNMKLKVKSISGAFMTCDIEIGGILGNKKAVNLPGTKVNLPALSDKDREIMHYAVENDFDLIFCPFVRSEETILQMRKELGQAGKHIKLIANIEDLQGLENIDQIIAVADGIVIARGDLYLEVTIPKLFIAQKFLLAKCNKAGCPVFVSRELIESMMENGCATRADISNITNVIMDGCDNVMLSRETLSEEYVVKIVKFVSVVCKESELTVWSQKSSIWKVDPKDIKSIISLMAVQSSLKLRANAIIVLTSTGLSAEIVAKYRPRCPILAVTRSARVARQLNLYRAVIPILYLAPMRRTKKKDIDEQINAALSFGKNRKIIKPNDPIVILYYGHSHTMEVYYIPEELTLIDDVLYIS